MSINGKTLGFVNYRAMGVCIAALLVGCGGESNNDSAPTPDKTPIQQNSPVTLDASSLKPVALVPTAKTSGQQVGGQVVAQAGLLNGTGNFDYPQNNSAMTGNLSLFVNADDPDGLRAVYLFFVGQEQSLALCSENCGSSFSALVNGISPGLFNWQNGQNTLELWLEDNAESMQQVATLSLNWSAPAVSGVSATFGQTNDQLTISWSSNSDLLRYNVYIAHEPVVTGPEVLDLQGGDVQLGVESNTVTFTGKNIETAYYIMVTGIDGTGESAYSDLFALAGGTRIVPPDAVNDQFIVEEDNSVSGNLMENDTTPSGSTISLNPSPVVPPQNGSLVLESNGNFTYTPVANFNGTDQFTYQIISTDQLVSSAVVTIKIQAVNDAPVANDETYDFDGDSITRAAPGVLANDTDVDQDTLTVVLDTLIAPEFGQLDMSENGQFTYTPGEGFVNFDSFQYQVTDGELTSEFATVNLSLETVGGIAPVAVNDAYTIDEDNLLQVSAEDGLLSNDSDADSELSTISIGITDGADNGQLVVSSDGSFSYNPNANFFGTDSFTYRLQDPEGNVATAVVTLTVNSVNDAPNAIGEQYVVISNQQNDIFRGIGILSNDSDADGDNLVIVADSVVGPSSGSLTLSEDGSFSYTPSEEFVGVDSFTYQITDGTLSSGTATVQLTVVDVHGSIADTETAEITLDEVASNLPDDATIVSIGAENGTVTISNGVITYTPALGVGGLDVITLEVEIDGETNALEFYIDVDSSNSAPVITSANSLSINEHRPNGTVIYQITATDADEHALTYSGTGLGTTFGINSSTGEVTVTNQNNLNYEQVQQFNITVIATDEVGASDSQVVQITLLNINEAPVISGANNFSVSENLPNGTEISYSLSATDPEGNQFVWSIVSDVYDIFAINSETGVMSIADNTNLDFETVESYNISIRAQEIDASPSNLSQTLTVTVNLTDVDEVTDTDGDGLFDSEENFYGSDINDSDSDDDGLNDKDEVDRGTNPIIADTDGDLISDGDEVAAGTDPLNSDVTAPMVASVEPSNGLTDVCVNQLVTVSFNEAIDPDSVLETSVTLLEGSSEVAGTYTVSENGLKIVYKSDAAFAENTLYDVQVNDVKDVAGNALASGFASQFTTGTCVESVKPTMIGNSPANGTQNTPLNAQVIVVMDEAIDPSSVNSSSVYVVDQVSGDNVPGTVSLSADGTTITFIPTDAYGVSRRHYVYLTTAIRDLFGNTFNGTYFYFDTSFEQDSLAPEITATSIPDGYVGLPTNGVLAVQFNEVISASSIGSISVVDSSGQSVSTTASVSHDQRRIVVTPEAALTASSNYQFIVSGVRDVGGNTMSGSETINFTTATDSDTSSGSISAWSLRGNNVTVARNPLLRVNFSERVDPTTITASTFYLWDSTMGLAVPTEIEVAEDAMSMNLVLSEPLDLGHTHYLYVGYSSFIYDLAGNTVAVNNYRYFVVEEEVDETPLAVADSSFTDGATGVPINGRVVVVFDQPVGGDCDLSDVTLTQGETLVEFSGSLSSDGLTYTFSPSANLDPDTAYTLTLNGLCDTSGNQIVETSFGFTTGSDSATDNSGPTLVSMTPAHTSTDVDVNTSIVLEYNETVDRLARPTITGGDITVPGDYSVSGSTITFTPSSPLQPGTRYTVNLSYNVPDLAGNVAWGSTRYFDTVAGSDTEAPSLISSSPTDGLVGFNPNQDVVLTFSEAILSSTLNSNNLALYHDGNVVNPSIYRSADGREVTLVGGKSANEIINVILTERITDVAGNPLAPTMVTFTTGSDTTESNRPAISRQIPLNGSSGWSNINEVYFYADEELSAASLEGNIRVAENGVLIDVTYELLGDGHTIKITKSSSFTEGARVQVYLDDEITDLAGNHLYSYNGYFLMDTSVDDIGTPVYIESYFPYSTFDGIPTNPLLLAKFTEDIDPLSLQPGVIYLEDLGNNSEQVPVTYQMGTNSRIIEVRPDVELTPGNGYYLRFTNAIKDTDGDSLGSTYTNYFVVAEDGVRDDRQPVASNFSPPVGENGVGINAEFSVQFDEAINPISFVHDQAVNIQFSTDNRTVKYNRFEPLPPSQQHTEQLPLVIDMSGNQVVSMTTTFTTDSGPDFVHPTVLDTSFDNNQSDVSLAPVFEWVYSEPIDRNSLTDNGVYIWDNQDNLRVPSTYELSADGKRLTLIPSEPLKVLRNYYSYAYYLRDLSGNSATNSYRYVNTGLEADEVGPTVVSSLVENDDTGVATNTRLNVRFNEALNPLSVEGVSLTDENGDDVAFDSMIDRSRTRLSITPKQLLQPMKPYTVSVTGVTDVSGNSQQEPYTANFTTSDATDIVSGSISRWSIPNNGTTGVALNPLLQVTFSEKVDPTTLDTDTMYLWDSSRSRRVPAVVTLSSDRQTATLTLAEVLRANATYYLYVGYSPYLRDSGGNYIGLNNYRYFYTGNDLDNASPAVSASNFDSGTTDVAVNGRIVLTFDEPLSDACALDQHISLSSANGDEAFIASLSSDRQSVTINASSNMAISTEYTVSINGLCDYSGNTIANYTLSFTTSASDAEDTTGPSLVSMTPAHTSTGVATDISTIVFEYDEPLDKRAAPPITGGSITVPGSYSVSGNTITFVPSIELAPSTRYTASLAYNVPDLSGNTSWGSTRYFDTVTDAEQTSPTVSAISPAPDAVDVDPAQSIVITFSEPMAQSPLNANNIGVFSNGSLISSSKTRSADGQQLTLSANLPANAVVTVVLNDALEDLSGNYLAPYVMSFTTGDSADNARPSVVRQIPSSGNSTRTSLDEFTIYMSEPMDASSLNDTLLMEEEGVQIEGDVTVSGDGRIIKVSRDGGFTPGVRTTFYLSGIRDLKGNYMFDHSGYIRLATDSEEDGVVPYVLGYYPASGTKGTPLNPVLLTRFSEPMDATSVAEADIMLIDTDNGNADVPIEVSLTSDPYVVAVTPVDDLTADTQYYLYFTAGILDNDGDAMASNYANYFRTEVDAIVDDAQPTVVAMSPPDGQTEVGINTRFSLRYNEPINSIGFDTSGDKENVQFSEDNTVVTFDTLHPLTPSSEFTLSTSGEKDLAGNTIVAQSNTFTVSDGPDLVSPSLLDVFATNNQQDVVVNPVMRWQFNEPIDIVTITDSGVYIWDDTNDVVIASNWELSSDGTRLSVSPVDSLTAGNRYYFYAYYLRDLSGNLAGNHYRYFTAGSTEDTEAPMVESSTVAEGDSEMPLNGKLQVRFNEPLNLVDSSHISLVDSGNNSVPVLISLSRERELLTLTPKHLLQSSESYTLTISGVEDLSANALADDFVLNFTTASNVDLVRGSVSVWSIPNNASDVPLNPLLQIRLNEKVDKTSIDEDSFYLWDTSTNAKVAASWSLAADGVTMTLTPDADLTASTQYYLYVGYSPYLTDYAGNLFYNNYHYFTTGTETDSIPISVALTNIASGEQDMPVNGRAILMMDNPVSDACLYSENVVLQNSAGVEISSTVSLDSSRRNITVTPSVNFSISENYSVAVSSLCDYAGNEFSGTPLTFTTLSSDSNDTTGPSVVSISPFNGETGVAISSSIVIQYNESVDRRSTPLIKAGSTLIEGSYSVTGDTITFTPTDPLSNSTTYTVELYNYVQDFAGRTLNGGTTSFTTVD